MSDEIIYAAHLIRTYSHNLERASSAWTQAYSEIRNAELHSEDLGKVGDDLQFPSQFNAVAEEAVTKMWQTASAVYSGAGNLVHVASVYGATSDKTQEQIEAMKPKL